MIVSRTEVHVINKNHRLFNYCDDVCFKSKNLYNRANYIFKKEYEDSREFRGAYSLNKDLKTEKVFKALPSKTSQQIIIQVSKNWKSYYNAMKSWRQNIYNFKAMPQLPNFKRKNGRNIVFFDYMQGSFKEGRYKFPKTDHFINTMVDKKDFRQCRIVPYGSCYKIEVIYRAKIPELRDDNNTLAIDLGLNNLATLTNDVGKSPIVVNGKVIKSINNYYNKKYGRLRSRTPHRTSRRIKKLSTKRKNILNYHLHKISKWIVCYSISNNIGKIVIGNNDDWKQKKRKMQHFTYVPYEDLINKISYKAENEGIKIEVIDEKYTSKSSFIDNDPLPEDFGDYKFSGKRVKRGLYKSKDGTLINADVNASYNILRKSNPEFSYDRIKGAALHPSKVTIS